jgi:ribosome maturation factor RimP
MPETIRALVQPDLTAAGLELWDVEVTRDTIRVQVDRPGGIDLDALASVASQVISPLLDEHPEATPTGPFQLEVSSPGVERTLRTVEQFQRYVGAEITVKTSETVAGARRHHGTLISADATIIRLTPADAPADALVGTVVELRHDQIDRARTVLAWGPTKSLASNKRTKRPAAPRPVAAKAASAALESKDTGS